MKTAMEKKEIGLMRQIGYLSFVVVLLYGLTLFAVSSDILFELNYYLTRTKS